MNFANSVDPAEQFNQNIFNASHHSSEEISLILSMLKACDEENKIATSMKLTSMLMNLFYLMTKYTENTLRQASKTLLSEFPLLSEHYKNHVKEEKGHELLVLADIQKLKACENGACVPLKHAREIESWYHATLTDCKDLDGAIAYFGYMYMTEILHIRSEFIECLEKSCKLKSGTLKSLWIHADNDINHIQSHKPILEMLIQNDHYFKLITEKIDDSLLFMNKVWSTVAFEVLAVYSS